MNKWMYPLLVVVLIVFISGCSSKANKDTKSKDEKKALVIAYDRDAETLNHIKTSDYHNALTYIFEKLVSRDNDFNFHPGLAEKWETSEDGLKWTFYLKKNVTFHDGSKLTAHDVKWTIDTIKDPETASPAQSEFEPIKEIVVEDDHTLSILLDKPYPNLLFRLSSTAAGIISKDAYEKYGDEYGSKYAIGTGPYKLKEWIKGDKIVLEKNPDYEWGPEWMENNGKPLIGEIVMKMIPEENLRMMELEAGNVHIVRDLTPTMMGSIEKTPISRYLPVEPQDLDILPFQQIKNHLMM